MDLYFFAKYVGSQLLINIHLIQEETVALSFSGIDAIIKVKILSLKLIAFSSMLI